MGLTISIGIGEDGKAYVSTNNSSNIKTNRLGKGKSMHEIYPIATDKQIRKVLK